MLAAMNFPTHRGTATAFPLAGFGLSAFFFSTVAGVISNDADEFLLVVSIGTSAMIVFPCFILRTHALPPTYTAVPSEPPQESRRGSQTAPKSKARAESRKRETSLEPGTHLESNGTSTSRLSSNSRGRSVERSDSGPNPASKDNLDSLQEETQDESEDHVKEQHSAHHSLYADVRGFDMLKYSECYELFMLVGLLTGIGLMTIK